MQNFTSFQNAITSISNLIGQVIPLIIGIAVLLFLIGLLRYVTAGADEEAKEAARGMIIYGIIVIFVMVTVWGFVRILARTFFQDSSYATPLRGPGVPTPNSPIF